MWLLILLLAALTALSVVRTSQKRYRKEVVLPGQTEKLNLILEQIKRNYVDTVDVKDLIEQTLPDFFEHLDPHSVYLSPDELESSEQSLQGNFDGIGIVFNVPNDTAVVINVITGGPSERAGLVSGDRIVVIDTLTVAGRKVPQDSLVKLLRGPSGTVVKLGIARRGNPDLIHFSIVRDKIPEKSVDIAYMINDTTGYIKLSKFARTTYVEFLRSMTELLKQGMRALIFDVRDNAGGYLDQALSIANDFLEKGKLVVYTYGAHRPRQDFINKKDGFFCHQPLVLLINEGSASSSEILAGALQDNDRGVIIGRRSFGKGLVQEPIYFSDKSGIRLTVARFYTPTGRSIQKPYKHDGSYDQDIYARYLHGELMQADSIPVNDSLRYETPKGKVVYGGGGIIPDIFVPLDTAGTNELFMQLVRKSIPIRFSMYFADRNRPALVKIGTLPELDAFYAAIDLEKQFREYARQQGVACTGPQWTVCRRIVLTQVKAYVGRNTPMDDGGFYPYLGTIDNVLQKAVETLQQQR